MTKSKLLFKELVSSCNNLKNETIIANVTMEEESYLDFETTIVAKVDVIVL